MKYFAFVLGLLFIVSCAHVSETSSNISPLDVDGTWKGVWDSKGKYDLPPKLLILKLKSDGDTITGTGCDATADPNKWHELKNIKRKGNTLYFSSTPQPGLTLKYDALVEGDFINLTFKWNTQVGVMSENVTLVREK